MGRLADRRGRCGVDLPAAVQGQYSYTTDNGAVTISGYTGSGGVVTMRDTINGLPVARIGASAFQGCTGRDSAFAECGSLTKVTIGNGLPRWQLRSGGR